MLLALKKQEVPFIVFADDFLFFGKSKRDIERIYRFVKESLSHLKLQPNPNKTESGLFAAGKFTYCGWEIKGGYYVISPQKIANFKEGITALLRDNKRSNLRAKIIRVNQRVNGFGHYYKYGNVAKQFGSLDALIRHQLREWLSRNLFSYKSNKQLETLGLRSLVALKKSIKQPIPTAKKFRKLANTLSHKQRKKPQLQYIEELLEKQTNQHKEMIGLLRTIVGLLKIEEHLY